MPSPPFTSVYHQGFVRVAAATHPHDDRRAGRQRGLAARGGARVPRRRRRPRRVPGAHALGLLDRGPADAGHPARRGGRRAGRRRRGVRRAHPGAGGRRAPAPPAPDLQLRGRRPPRAGAGRGAEDLPAELPRVLRAPPARGRRRRGRHDAAARRGRAVRLRPALRRRRRRRPGGARRGLRGHVRPDPAERRGGAGRGDGAGEPLGQPHHGRARRRPPAPGPVGLGTLLGGLRLRRGRRRGVDHRGLVGRPDQHPRERRAARRDRALPGRRAPRRRRRRPAAAALRAPADGHVRRQPPPPRADGRHDVPHRGVHPRPADRRPRVPARRRALPVRADRPRPPRAGLLRGLQHPGRRPPAAAAGDRRRQGRHRGLRADSTPPTR